MTALARLPFPPAARFLRVATTLALAGCASAAPPAFVDSAQHASRIEVRAGIPRGEAPQEGVVRLHGELFSDRFVELDDTDRTLLGQILADESTYTKHREDKKCGGFHADYAVQWKAAGAPYQVLLCFGCHEALSVGDGGERLNDLSEAGYQKLVPIFDRAARR